MKLLFVGALYLSYCGVIAMTMSLDPSYGILAGLAILIAAEVSLALSRGS